MMKTILLLALLVAVCAANLHDHAEEHWRDFQAKYAKTYEEGEADKRFHIFKNNLKKIDKLNKRHTSATFGINKLADLTSAEIDRRYKMPNFRPRFSEADYKPLPEAGFIADSFDWRDKNAITPVKDQGQCGSCWAFSATEEIESNWILKGNKPVYLAPQQIVDCDGKDGGCDGGDTPTAYQYVIKAGGMEQETDYPYKAKDEKCMFDKTKVVAKISSWQYVVRRENETQMLGALASAPLSICVDAETWDYYQSGVLDKDCADDLDHCVQLVGWGTDAATQKPFWNVRNSWGTDWGEQGYIRIERDQGNLCGVASEVTVGIV